jgi:hypothetical protein
MDMCFDDFHPLTNRSSLRFVDESVAPSNGFALGYLCRRWAVDEDQST